MFTIYSNLLLIIGAALLFQAGWMIDFSLTDIVYIPFLNHTYQVKGNTWFLIANIYLLIVAGVLAIFSLPELILLHTDLFYSFNFTYHTYIFIFLLGIYLYILAVTYENRQKYLSKEETLTVYGQKWNILFYSLVVVFLLALLNSGVL
jgi:hypothetical protein